MVQGVVAGLFWGLVVSALGLVLASQVADYHVLESPRIGGPAVPAGSGFRRGKDDAAVQVPARASGPPLLTGEVPAPGAAPSPDAAPRIAAGEGRAPSVSAGPFGRLPEGRLSAEPPSVENRPDGSVAAAPPRLPERSQADAAPREAAPMRP